MPGVVINTAVRTGPTGNTVRETSQAFFVGQVGRGNDSAAVRVDSIEEFEAVFGGYVSYGYLYDTVATFFEEGGTRAYVARVVGPAATSGSLDLLDDASGASLTITAQGAGNWSENVDVQIRAGIATGSRALDLYYEGNIVYSTGDCLSADQMAGLIALNAIASRLVSVTVTGTGMPAIMGDADSLSAGDDDRTSITTTEYNAALERFLDSYGSGVVCNTDSTSNLVHAALVAHASAYNRVAFLHAAAGTSVTDASTAGRTLSVSVPNAEHAQMVYPWVYRPTSVPGVSRLIPPLGYAAGVRARAHNQVGPQQPGAGLISNARFITGVEYDLDKSQGDQLDNSYVAAIRTINNTIRLYGARSLSNDVANFRYLTGQEVVNHVVVEANRTLEDLLFSVIDGRNNVFASVQAKLIAVLEPLRVAGALYEAFDANGRRIDYGYTVKCDSSLNPVTQLADGLIRAKVGVRVSSVGDKIEVDIVKSNLTTSVV